MTALIVLAALIALSYPVRWLRRLLAPHRGLHQGGLTDDRGQDITDLLPDVPRPAPGTDWDGAVRDPARAQAAEKSGSTFLAGHGPGHPFADAGCLGCPGPPRCDGNCLLPDLTDGGCPHRGAARGDGPVCHTCGYGYGWQPPETVEIAAILAPGERHGRTEPPPPDPEVAWEPRQCAGRHPRTETPWDRYARTGVPPGLAYVTAGLGAATVAEAMAQITASAAGPKALTA